MKELFVELTCFNESQWVNIRHIISINGDDDGGSRIELTNDRHYRVKETPREIFNKMREIYTPSYGAPKTPSDTW